MKRLVLGAIALVFVAAACQCGGRGPQAQECKDYLACVDRTPQGGAGGNLVLNYGPTGTCWTTPMGTASCATNCSIALNAARGMYPDAGC